jgi:hypothetical protein
VKIYWYLAFAGMAASRKGLGRALISFIKKKEVMKFITTSFKVM